MRALGGDDVAAVAVVLKPDALAPALATYAYAYLVELAGLGARRDKPLAGAEVLKVFAVVLEEPESSKDVGGDRFGGGWVRWLR